MSVRATGSLIGEVVVTTGIKGPKMVVLAVDEEQKQITTIWFSNDGLAQRAVFPTASLDRAEVPPAPDGVKKPAGIGKRGRPSKK